MMYFKTICKIVGPSVSFQAIDGFGTPLDQQKWEMVYSFKEIKKNLSQRSALPDSEKCALAKIKDECLLSEIVNRPAFAWVSYYHEPVVVEVRLISKKEFLQFKKEQNQADMDATEEYGERKLFNTER